MLYVAYNPETKEYVGPGWFERTTDLEYAKTYHTEQGCKNLVDNNPKIFMGFTVIEVTLVRN